MKNIERFSPSFPFHLRFLLVITLLLLILSGLPGSLQPASVHAAQATQVYGYLPAPGSQQAYTLLPTSKESVITVDFSFDPKDNASINNQVNFWVIPEEGMHQIRQAGAEPYRVAVAAGNFVPERGDHFLRATFNVVAIRPYTVIVYSTARIPVNFQLSVQNGSLAAVGSAAGAAQRVIASSRAQSSGTTSNTKKKTTVPKPTTRIEEVVLGPKSKHFLTIDPSKKDVNVNVTMTFRPSDRIVLGSVNFFLFDENGARELVAGAQPTSVNLAAGNVVDGIPGELRARVKAVATHPFTIMVENRSDQSIVYTLVVSGGKFRPE